ncbi:MAG: phage tail protein [Sediminibacterium sp.]|nr:phage tail protein [Sediminibacterium sp.]
MNDTTEQFYFQVALNDCVIAFQEVTGLVEETQIIEYKTGNSPIFSTVKMPGIRKYGNITFKKGMLVKGNSLKTLFKAVQMNQMERKSITISLLDQKGQITMHWVLLNAFPVKITMQENDINPQDPIAAVESMEIAHEGIEIAAP